MNTNSIDLNCDLGEGYGAWQMGDDLAMLDIVSSANVACGFHAGDPNIMAELAKQTLNRGIAFGAHPSFNDREGFGRREIHGLSNLEVHNLVIYQIGALKLLAHSVGQEVSHVRPHGALANMAEADTHLGQTVVQAVKAADASLIMVSRPNSATDIAAKQMGLKTIQQVFADRVYLDDGSLVPRSHPQAVLHDAKNVAERCARMVQERQVESINGAIIKLEFDTICVHGDTPSAVKMADAIRHRLEAEGLSITPFTAGF